MPQVFAKPQRSPALQGHTRWKPRPEASGFGPLPLVKLPFAAGTVNPKLNQAAALALGDITCSAVRSTEADIGWLGAQHVDLAHHFSLR